MNRSFIFVGVLVVLAVGLGIWLLGGGHEPAVNSGDGHGASPSHAPAPAGGAAAISGETASADKGLRSEVDAPKGTDVKADVVKDAARVHGRVVASESSAPIANAKIFLDPHFGPMRVVFLEDSGTPKEPSATTGPDGAFEIRGVDLAKIFELRVEAPSRRRARVNLPRLTKGESRNVGDVTLEQGAAIEGRVTDHAGGPISGARVASARAPQGGGPFAFSMSLSGPDDTEGLTDGQGRYRLDGLAPNEPYIVNASAETRVSAKSEPLTPRLGTALAAPDLVLREGKEITGTVVKRDGSRVAQAVVTTRASRSGPGGGIEYLGDPRGRKPVLTDAEGKFRITGLDDKNVDVVVRAEAAGSARKKNVTPGTRDLMIELEPQGTVRGKLVAAPGVDKNALANLPPSFEVFAERALGQGVRGFSMADQESEGRSLEGGAFEVTNLATGKYRIHARVEGYAPTVSDVLDITPGRVLENVEIAVTPGGTLEVKVTKAGTQEPVKGAKVRVKEVREEDPDMGRIMSGFGDEASDEDWGDDVAGGSGDVRVRAVRAAAPVSSSGSTGGASHAPKPMMPLPGDGKPVPFTKTLETNAEGIAKFTGLPIASFDVRARKLDLAPSESERVALDGATALTVPAQTALALSEGGAIEGVVTRGGADPAAGVRVELTGPEPSMARKSATTDVKGSYRFEHLTAGTYHAQVEKGGPEGVFMGNDAAPEGAPVAVVDGKTAALDLTAPILVTVTGTVTQAGAPVAGVRVTASELGEGRGGFRMAEIDADLGIVKSATTGSDGKFKLEGLEAGKYRFKARRPGAARASSKDVDLTSDKQRVDLTLPRGVIEGRVVKAENSEPVGGASVAILEGGGGEQGFGMVMMTMTADNDGGNVVTYDGRTTVKADAEGRFKLEDVPAGKYRLRATSPGLREAKTEAFELAEDARVRDMDLKMEKAAILTGRVTGPGGAAKPGAMVTLTSLTKSGPGRPELKMTDSEGRYRFDSLDPGEYRVHAQGLGEGGVMRIEAGGSKGIAVTLQGGVETTKDIQLDK